MIEKILSTKKINALNPIQEEALEKGVLKGNNLIVSAPTGSGKTLIAEMAALNVINQGKKAVYTCPLRALALEHYKEFRKYDVKVALSIGDYDSSDTWLEKYDWIVTTYEKLDSLLRHRAPWIKDIGLLIVDEIHEIDGSRGPTLEILISKIRHMNPNVQIIGLSATIPNTDELGEWLNAGIVESDYRPTKLKEGVFFRETIYYNDGSVEHVPCIGDELISLIKESLKFGSVLIFTNSRKSAEKLAEKISKEMNTELTKESEMIKRILDPPTEQCILLSKVVKRGVAFHHAGLVQKQRELIEDWFRNGKLNVIVATPTLAAGVNLPARRVIIHTLYYFDGIKQEKIRVRDYKQRAGRAGRPKYDTTGEAIIMVRSSDEIQDVMERYVYGTPEKVFSRLGNPAALRFHVLSLLSEIYINDLESLLKFFRSTFFFVQNRDSSFFEPILQKTVNELELMGFVKNYEPTEIGRRVSELYIDPLSAYNMINALTSSIPGSENAYLYMIVDTTEMKPYPSVKNEGEYLAKFYTIVNELFRYDYDDYWIPNKMKLLEILKAWINEESEKSILEHHGIPPGTLRGYVLNAEWLAYAALELAKLLGADTRIGELRELMIRLKHGVKRELIPLVSIQNIGRVRARTLYQHGIKTPGDLIRDQEKASTLLGKNLVKKIIKNLKIS